MSGTGLAHTPSLVEAAGCKFLIIDCPTDANLGAYIEVMSSNKVKHLVRATECAYAVERATKVGITVHDMAFPDGEPPPQDIIKRWLKLCQTTFGAKDGSAISVHCVAGLGRAPVLVAIALIEKGLEPLDAVALIRDKRKGAINSKQLDYLENKYKKVGGGCVIV